MARRGLATAIALSVAALAPIAWASPPLPPGLPPLNPGATAQLVVELDQNIESTIDDFNVDLFMTRFAGLTGVSSDRISLEVSPGSTGSILVVATITVDDRASAATQVSALEGLTRFPQFLTGSLGVTVLSVGAPTIRTLVLLAPSPPPPLTPPSPPAPPPSAPPPGPPPASPPPPPPPTRPTPSPPPPNPSPPATPEPPALPPVPPQIPKPPSPPEPASPPLPPLAPFVPSEVVVSPGFFPSEVTWVLDCGLGTPITGSAPYAAFHLAPQGSCTLTLSDVYGDGWNGAEWSARGWTADVFAMTTGMSMTVSLSVGFRPPSPPSPPPRGPPPTAPSP